MKSVISSNDEAFHIMPVFSVIRLFQHLPTSLYVMPVNIGNAKNNEFYCYNPYLVMNNLDSGYRK